MRLLCFLLITSTLLPAKSLINKSLDGWEARGDGIWKVTSDGVLVGQRPPFPKDAPAEGTPQFRPWFYQQAWIFTKAEYANFDLHVEYWLPIYGNSGVGLRDTSRA